MGPEPSRAIPSHPEPSRAHLELRRNFHAALAYIQHYPRQYGNEIQRTLGVSKGIFVQQVVPTIYSIAGKMAL